MIGWWLCCWLAGCLPKVPVQNNKGLEPAASTLEALQQARATRREAVVIGVDRYADPTFPPLKFAEADARDLAARLQSTSVGGFDKVHLLTGAGTTRAAIVSLLQEVRDTLRAQDVLVVYFSGHGTRRKDDTTGWHRYLLPTDVSSTDLARTALDLRDLQTFFGSLAPARKALIVDACFDGDGRSVVDPSQWSSPGDTLVPATGAIGAGEAHLFATSAGRPAREDDALEHGVYTFYLLEALSWAFADADVDGDRVLTAWEAHDWARGRTMVRTGGAQVPEAAFRVLGEGDVVLAGDPEPRRRTDRGLVYLYPTERQDWSGATLVVDGRDKGTLPGTVPVPPGRHHFLIRGADGEVAVDGFFRVGGGRAYTVDEVARLAQGPTAAVGLRPFFVTSAPFREQLGPGALGTELYVADRRDTPSGRGFLVDGALGVAATPTAGRPIALVSGHLGWQGDVERFRLRAGVGVSFGWLPPYFPGGRPPGNLDPKEVPANAGWYFAAAGPMGAAGLVLGGGWSATATVRPHLASLDADGDGRTQLVPFTSLVFGLEVDR